LRSARDELIQNTGSTGIARTRFKDSIYVLHAFQKKSTRGIATPKREIDLVRRRLADAERHHRERLKSHGEEDQD
jgi:phage-related protein